MNLDLLNNLIKNKKENKLVQELIKDLNGFMEKDKLEIPILEQIQNKRATSMYCKNSMRNKKHEILKKYAEETISKGQMFYIDNKPYQDKEEYNVFKFENGKEATVKLKKEQLPAHSNVNSILRLENDEFVLDEESTNFIKNEILKMANDLLDNQDKELIEKRKENHIYMVTEEINDRRFFMDITEKLTPKFEEVEFPKNLLEQATEGTVFIYKDGKYQYYSKDGYDRIENLEN